MAAGCRHSKIVIVGLFILSLQATKADAQSDWRATILDNQLWRCEIQRHKLAAYAPTNNVQLIRQEDSLIISDFTGGLLMQYSDTTTLSVTVEFNGRLIIPITVITPYGPCEVSGSWDTQFRKLTLNWKIPFNKLDEVSVFTPMQN